MERILAALAALLRIAWFRRVIVVAVLTPTFVVAPDFRTELVLAALAALLWELISRFLSGDWFEPKP